MCGGRQGVQGLGGVRWAAGCAGVGLQGVQKDSGGRQGVQGWNVCGVRQGVQGWSVCCGRQGVPWRRAAGRWRTLAEKFVWAAACGAVGRWVVVTRRGAPVRY